MTKGLRVMQQNFKEHRVQHLRLCRRSKRQARSGSSGVNPGGALCAGVGCGARLSLVRHGRLARRSLRLVLLQQLCDLRVLRLRILAQMYRSLGNREDLCCWSS